MKVNDQQLHKALDMARRALAVLEEQAAGYGSLEIPVSLKIQLEDKRAEVAALKQRLGITPEAHAASLGAQNGTSIGTQINIQGGVHATIASGECSVAIGGRASNNAFNMGDALPASPPSEVPPQPLPPSPFCVGAPIADDAGFYGRQAEVRQVLERLTQGGCTSIVGERRIGKSSLLHYLERRATRFIVYLDLTRPSLHTRAGLMRALRRELEQSSNLPFWDEDKDGDLIALEDALQEWQQAGRQLLLLLDEVDRLIERAAEFNDVLDLWRVFGQTSALNIVTASRLPLAELAKLGNLVSPFHNIFIEQCLGLLAEADWRRLVRDGFKSRGLPLPENALPWIEDVAGGHPFYTQMAGDVLYQWRRDHAAAPDYVALTSVFTAQARATLKSLWEHLTAREQAALRALRPDARILADLERRGLLRNGRSFSSVFAQGIREGWWEEK